VRIKNQKKAAPGKNQQKCPGPPVKHKPPPRSRAAKSQPKGGFGRREPSQNRQKTKRRERNPNRPPKDHATVVSPARRVKTGPCGNTPPSGAVEQRAEEGERRRIFSRSGLLRGKMKKGCALQKGGKRELKNGIWAPLPNGKW